MHKVQKTAMNRMMVLAMAAFSTAAVAFGGDSGKIPAGGGTKTYSIAYAAGEQWKFDISKRPSWVTRLLVDGEEFGASYISFSRKSSSGGTVVLSATASANSGAERKWSIPITCDSASRGSVDVVQAGTSATGLPAAPGTPVATAKDATTISVSWSKSSNATKYKLWRADNGKQGDSDFKLIATQTGTTYTDSGLKPETTYSYKVSAVNAKGETMCPRMGSATTPARQSKVEPVPVGKLAFGPGEGSMFDISSSEKAVVVGVSSLTWASFSKRAYKGEKSEDDRSSHSYYTFDDSRIVDAEKNSTKEDFDDCWCSALSEMDIFFWAGWIRGYDDEDAVKNYMRKHASENDGGWSFYDLVSSNFSESDFVGSASGLAQFTKAFEGADRLFCLCVDFDENYIWKGGGGVSHCVVCCGYSLDAGKDLSNPSALKGLFIIDSDSDMYNGAGGASAPDSITYCPVKWNSSRKVYAIDNVFGARGTFELDSMYYIRTKTAPKVHFTSAANVVTCKVKAAGSKGGGTVSGGGKCVSGSKTTLKAKAKKGYVFAGWFTDKACKKPLNPKGYDNRKATVKYVAPKKNATIYAKFVTIAADKKALKFSSATKKLAKTPAKATVGSKLSLKLGFSSASLPKVTAKGLPNGLKINKTTGKISGTPTKTGTYTVTVTVKSAAGNKIKQKVKITVKAS